MQQTFRTLVLVVAAFTAAMPAAAVDWSNPQSIVDTAVDNHPTLVRLRAEAAAARERIAPSASQANPMLMAGINDKMVTLEDDEMMTMYMVGASQTFTRPSKLAARRESAELAVRALEQQIESARAEIARDALFGWLEIASIDDQTAATRNVREIVGAIIDAARVRYEVGNAIQADVIRAQLEKSNLDHQLMRLDGRRKAAIARLLPLAGLPLETVVPTLSLPRSTRNDTVPDTIVVPADHAALLAQQSEIARQESEIRLAKLLTKPDFGIEASYGYRRMQTDMFSVVGTIELPLRRKSLIEPRVREAILRRDAAQLQVEEIRRAIATGLAVAKAAHDEATQQLDFHEQVLVPQAKMAIDSTLAAYQTGSTGFDSILATENAYLRLTLDFIDFLAAHAKAVADFEAIQKGARSGATAGVPSSAAGSAPSSAPAGSPAMSSM